MPALERLRAAGFSAPTQVYRALKRLEEDGLVRHLKNLHAYILCSSQNERDITVYVICDQCEQVDELTDTELNSGINQLASRHNFVAFQHDHRNPRPMFALLGRGPAARIQNMNLILPVSSSHHLRPNAATDNHIAP